MVCGVGVVLGVVVVGRGPLGPLGYWRAAAPAAFEPEAPMVSEGVEGDGLVYFVVIVELYVVCRVSCVMYRKTDDDAQCASKKFPES